ncbi:hypothetical protein chiPu_0028599, partial [Chiloscyllium punctatum]|nr:hypothetical protein [Chiloscyllium punctatum]
YELLYQPEVVRLYLSLMKESKNPAVLEAVAGALQNLCAGRWTVSVPSLHWPCACWKVPQVNVQLRQHQTFPHCLGPVLSAPCP